MHLLPSYLSFYTAKSFLLRNLLFLYSTNLTKKPHPTVTSCLLKMQTVLFPGKTDTQKMNKIMLSRNLLLIFQLYPYVAIHVYSLVTSLKFPNK